jgi:L-cystine uptake protein TcyP (sodium:dicarboxylate symporter family)
MDLILIGLSFVFLSFYFFLFKMKKNEKSFNYRVFSALAGGLFFGGVIQYFFGTNNQVVQFSELISVFGSGYIKLLKMIVIPLVLVAMIASIMNVDGQKTLSKISRDCSPPSHFVSGEASVLNEKFGILVSLAATRLSSSFTLPQQAVTT